MNKCNRLTFGLKRFLTTNVLCSVSTKTGCDPIFIHVNALPVYLLITGQGCVLCALSLYPPTFVVSGQRQYLPHVHFLFFSFVLFTVDFTHLCSLCIQMCTHCLDLPCLIHMLTEREVNKHPLSERKPFCQLCLIQPLTHIFTTQYRHLTPHMIFVHTFNNASNDQCERGFHLRSHITVFGEQECTSHNQDILATPLPVGTEGAQVRPQQNYGVRIPGQDPQEVFCSPCFFHTAGDDLGHYKHSVK